MRRFLLALVFFVGLTGLSSSAQEKTFFFKPGDRIVFLGDSITEQYQYSSYMELYLTTRYPNGKFVFLNAGISGDTANGGAGRFQSHVLDEKPTAITINFGMNDAGYGKFDENRNKVYVQKTEAMIEAASKQGVRVALCSPNAVDRRVDQRFKLYVETQKEFYAPLKGLAEKYKFPFADQYAVTRAAVEAMEKDDPEAKKAKPYYDGFHTSPPGGLLMAHAILTQLNAPALVSEAAIDAGEGKAVTKACKVTDVATKDGVLTFKREDEALPLPIQKDWVSMLPYTNQLKDLNYYGLTVKGLKDGDYVLAIDGKEIGKYSSKDLASGVNIGNVTTGPIFEQANKVLQAINEKNKIVHARFRGVVMYNNPPDWLADVVKERKPMELKKRLEKIDEEQKKIYELAKPVAHTFTLTPAK